MAWTKIYSQENIPIIYQNVQWGSYSGANASKTGPTWLACAGGAYPFPEFIPDASLAPMTFYNGDGSGVNAIGKRGALSCQVSGAQGGSTIGLSLAPRALEAQPGPYAVLINRWLPVPRACFAPGALGAKLSLDLVVPFIYVPPAGDGSIPQQGIVFAYFVLWLQHVNDTAQQLYITPRVVQSTYPTHGEPAPYSWGFNPGDQFSFDPSNNNAGIIAPELGNSGLVTSLGSGHFTIGSSPIMKTYAFSVSPAQLAAGIAGLNASGRSPRSYDPNASKWKVIGLCLNVEAWPGSTHNDVRIALSAKNFGLWVG